ncbi:putative baseplate assembly protein [Streptomyces sp. ISL-36]|uniref:putative baseplate assembly protein n=1 Tax=Streptomyces sp. ISL-36 TaxID=2819182 RepID=UPI001BEA564B|nr:putative baseplate assembly protein [Streptomyces sp. ISL-36]MBT2442698.1 putative baseplate assembly protein [Streptomyces sp. ISL-36]
MVAVTGAAVAPVFTCADEKRRQKVRESTTHNGIDYLEVDPDDQRRLAVHFLHPLPGQTGGIPATPALDRSHVVVEGGERVTAIGVTGVEASGSVLTVSVDRAGDFSSYTLRLVSRATPAEPPDGFDPVLAMVRFSFKVGCLSAFDCRPRPDEPPPSPAPPVLDYLAKDYEGFRRLMLDRLGTLLPTWTDRSPADGLVNLVELFAHIGDQLSYFQDAVATEAYLGTARSRISARRHARLLDHHVHDGTNARAWIAIDVKPDTTSNGQEVKAGTPVLLGRREDAKTLSRAQAEALGDVITFETMHPLTLVAARSRIAIHTWSADSYCLPAGCTSATLVDAGFVLAAGDVLIFEETAGRETGLEADADPAHRHAVRLIEARRRFDPLEQVQGSVGGRPVYDVRWHHADALPFPLWVKDASSPGAGEQALAVARGNVVLADHGRGVTGRKLPPVPDRGRYRPVLPDAPLSNAEPYVHDKARTRPASDVFRRSPDTALPQVWLTDELGHPWRAQLDLLGSDRFDRDLVVETERDETARLRFGDDVHGMRPLKGTTLTASFRIGNGPEGNVGHGTLRRLVWDREGIEDVTNPLPARGGTRPESMAEIKEFAPQSFRVQQRAVTEADWEEVARRHPEVQNAKARFRWTGSWYTVFLTLDRRDDAPVTGDPAFLAELSAHLRRFRIAGYDLEVTGPQPVALDLELSVCVKPGYFAREVERELLDVFGPRRLADGTGGFFAPDRFTFGQPLYVSEIHRAAMSVAGVAFVTVTRFQRFGRVSAGERDRGLLAVGDLEVIRLDNDPSRPERGQLRIVTEGGL